MVLRNLKLFSSIKVLSAPLSPIMQRAEAPPPPGLRSLPNDELLWKLSPHDLPLFTVRTRGGAGLSGAERDHEKISCFFFSLDGVSLVSANIFFVLFKLPPPSLYGSLPIY